MPPGPSRSAGVRSSVQKQQRVEVAGVGRLADQQVLAARQALARLVGRHALVIAANAGRHVSVERVTGDAGRVTIDRATAKGADLRPHVRGIGDDAGEVHDLR